MLYLALAVACSLAIGMIFKLAGRRGMDRVALLTVNYAAAVATAGVLLATGREVQGGLTADPALLSLGVFTGALLIAGFFVLSMATDVAGMSLALGVMRVSVVIPFVMSWWIWNEVPSAAQVVGLVLASVAFFLIARRERRRVPQSAATPVIAGSTGGLPDPPDPSPSATDSSDADVHWKAFIVLALLFLSGGAVDVSMKTFEETFGATNSRVLFLLLAFGVSFLIGAAWVLWTGLRRGRWPERGTIRWGVILGVINYGSLEFILRAINRLPGTFVFPVNNIAVVVLAAGLGVYVWGERLSRVNRIGLALAVVALILLSIR